MSTPTAVEAVLVHPEGVTALAAELTVLAAELSDDADRCRAAAGALTSALDGDDGWTAGAAATAWAGLEELLAEQAAALAGTLTGAVQSYLAEDARIARGTGPGRSGVPR
ncbi:hypothetical protein [Blastococcus mobilis]|uniref:Uncharacterized protein n=1 Tax=Blastococcus mobilis TaxID=1938746 RepID=A0A238VY97_9ACTN|nr:hypothetical protein [Blastococcus mobilis]SNR39141.1 hypothetical protein SAMN06272737_105155 [Blastococcus mobilis]